MLAQSIHAGPTIPAGPPPLSMHRVLGHFPGDCPDSLHVCFLRHGIETHAGTIMSLHAGPTIPDTMRVPTPVSMHLVALTPFTCVSYVTELKPMLADS
jgi:hypothetical protein